MTPLLKKLLGMHWLLFVVMLALAVFGVIAIYSCTYLRDNAAYASMWRKQSVWVAASIPVFIATSLTPYRWIRWGALPLYGISVVFLVMTLAMGVSKDGARCWLHLGPILFQPAQLAVVSGILIIALFLTQYARISPPLQLVACGLIAGAPGLLILMQPDLGECLVWIPVVFAMLFIGRIPLRYLVVIVLLVASALPVAYHFKLKPYQQARIVTFIDPEIDARGAAWAVNQCLIAIGSGGWSGKGFLAKNSQVELGYVPSTTVPNDYIFSAIGEQWGFLGGATLVGAFGLLLGSCLHIATRAADRLGLLLCTGVLTLLFAHTFQNIGMNLGLLPVTGVPLPLISYSGSFVFMIVFGLGLVNSVWVHRKD
ncbi:MAG: FtsW/RodA/SpoVE family cell cycle protein [Chthoniobacteraceae bacterium]|nr:FtsW/RodA/SpoVE family cell cycle protein [Chthoniobacteraceae bacterium]